MDITFYRAIEHQYEQEDFLTAEEFQLVAGSLPVLISTPHSVTHFREGKEKFGEFMTAALAIRLHGLTNCSYITKQRNNLTDPNYDEQHPYKDAIIQFVKQQDVRFMLDLHIMSSNREANIEIGTGKGKNIFGQTELVQQLVAAFEQQQLQPIIVDQLFTAGNPNTVSSTVARETTIPSIQIEINWRLLDTNSSTQQIEQVIKALVSFIQNHKKNVRE